MSHAKLVWSLEQGKGAPDLFPSWSTIFNLGKFKRRGPCAMPITMTSAIILMSPMSQLELQISIPLPLHSHTTSKSETRLKKFWLACSCSFRLKARIRGENDAFQVLLNPVRNRTASSKYGRHRRNGVFRTPRTEIAI